MSSFFADIVSTIFPAAHAEAPVTTEDEHSSAGSSDEPEPEVIEQEEKEEEEEEEEEEEPEDIMPALEEECANSKACEPAKHHFEECVARVTKDIEEHEAQGKKRAHGEDCVEEWFHLAHCVDPCVAPKLWSKLK
ncbi:Non-heme 11 kDa protein of cytochrome bc1 complex [Saitoella complicata NRRL Y-17804]|uniref:Cytochrome b-c1 complex subunit 6, mitochondrial n=1 Tax=Saitoella complicata (strain BCRC 22490 / CBS 7301 / JCM 7358 / NBRC 10748 / NRRL Y-17804) TaxID=698492 RepID=A0A0E9NGD4_SAICN|nr:Non-heme 11 kDa protein of cytochrome bc1 complex [Saitoella complicata NRRL Y-17804]ODQ53392.1 Non-heme 11 kDa protein of cytochrome bc1 complex [Saitoella complicata NRRL Y-17804]GAO48932.1 hypothetical protein G7K_3094-t1 [Saitoella complicata NRRL Y-17804]